MRVVRDVMTPDPIVVSPDTTIAACARQLRHLHVRHLLVVTGADHVAGQITDAAVHALGSLSGEAWVPNPGVDAELTVARVVAPVERIDQDAPIRAALSRMAEGTDDVLAVVDDAQRAVGIVTAVDLLRLAAAELPPDRTVGDIAARLVLRLAPTATAGEAFATLHAHGLRHLAVLDEDELVGVLSIRDLVEAGAAGADRPVRELASPPSETCSPGESLRTAAERMARQKVGCLPVLSEDRLVALLEARDVIRELRALK